MIILGVTFLGIITKLLIAVNVLVCFLLIFVVLMQRPKNEGLGAAFGVLLRRLETPKEGA